MIYLKWTLANQVSLLAPFVAGLDVDGALIQVHKGQVLAGSLIAPLG
jgi:hypothetical protein